MQGVNVRETRSLLAYCPTDFCSFLRAVEKSCGVKTARVVGRRLPRWLVHAVIVDGY
jgi:hypothetical protein